MALDKLQEDLYAPEERKRGHEKTVYNPDVSRTSTLQLGEESPWQAKEGAGGLERGYRKPLLWIAIGFATFILLAFAVWTFMNVRAGLFDVGRVLVAVNGPTTASSGMAATYTITIENNNGTRLDDAELVIEHTPTFVVDVDASGVRYDGSTQSTVLIGEIAAGGSRSFDISGRFEGAADAAMYIEPHLNFVPATTGDLTSVKQRLGIAQDRNALALAIDSQQSVSPGTTIEYRVRYTNNSDSAYEDVRLVADFPQGFTLTESVPEVGEDGNWALGTIESGVEKNITIRGTLDGVVDETKLATFVVEGEDGGQRVVFAREQWVARIATPTLVIRQMVNGQGSYVARPGEDLRYSLVYENTSDLGMRDVIVRFKIDDRILDYRKLQMSQMPGALEAATRSIVWKASNVPGLEILSPGERGQIEFSIPVRTTIEPRDDNDQNFTIQTIAEIDSPDVPTPIGTNKIVSSSSLAVKLVSPIAFTMEGFYDDFTIANTGPNPPLLNEKTTYTMRWTVSNATNDLTNARVEMSLPSWVSWTGRTHPEDAPITYNERTNKVVWNIGEMQNGVGYFRKKEEVRFQIAITPTVDKVNEVVPLTQDATFTAQDVFAGVGVRAVATGKTTSLAEDPTTQGGTVRQ